MSLWDGSIGYLSDFLGRIKAELPKKWFGNGDTPVLDAVLSAPARAFSDDFSLLKYVQYQTRIKTATGPFLDLVSQDFYNGTLPRLANETDANFRARILANLFIKGPARKNLVAVLEQITGRTPEIVEPYRPQDCGGWDQIYCGWDESGHWGDHLPFQAFVTAYRPLGTGIPYITGWDFSYGGWDTPSQIEWTDNTQTEYAVSDDAIYAAINSNKPAGTVLWARIASSPVYP